MNRLLSCTVVLAACFAAFSCGDPTADLRSGPAKIVSDPTSLIMNRGQTKAVVVRVTDDQGNELADSVSVTFPTGLVSVRVDSTFLVSTDTTTPPGQIPSTGRTRTKFLITGEGSDSGTVVFNSGDLSLNVPVRVFPDTLAATISPQSAQPGEIVTITAAPLTSFDDTVHVLFGASEAVIVSRAPDGSSLQIQPAPGSTGHATIQGVKLAFAQASDTTPISLALATRDTVFVTPVTEIPAVFSASNPAVNQIVTMTAAGFKFLADSVGISFETGGPAIILGVSADSNTVSFRGAPGSTGVVTVNGAVLSVLTGIPLTLTATSTITVGTSIPAMAGTATTVTAPTVTVPDGFFDAGSFTGADITADEGVGAQYYKFTPAADADVTITLRAQSPAPDTDLDLVLCSDATCSDGGNLDNAVLGSSDEVGTFSVTAGTTYYIAVVLFAGGAPGGLALVLE